MRKFIAVLAIAGAAFLPSIAHADGGLDQVAPVDVVGTLYAAAQNHGLSPEKTDWLLWTAKCESNNQPYILGDDGHSAGLMQLYDGGQGGPTNGLLHYFYQAGYDDPFDAGQAADYVATIYALDSTDLVKATNWFHGLRNHVNGTCP